jgi:hypothetical protein
VLSTAAASYSYQEPEGLLVDGARETVGELLKGAVVFIEGAFVVIDATGLVVPLEGVLVMGAIVGARDTGDEVGEMETGA